MSIHLYLSPHLDDAALSCGGRMAAQAAAGERVRVVNVFAGIPDYSRLSAYAERQHGKWGWPTDPVASRRAEDEAVLHALGAEVEHWEDTDCIYRQVDGQFVYTDHDAVFGPVHPAETALITRLASRLGQVSQSLPDAHFYAPLALGGHVDHRIVRAAAGAVQHLGADVGFYEDFPYATQPAALQAVQAELGGHWTSELTPIDVEAKIQVVAGYASQLLAVFHDPARMPQVVREYAGALEAGGYFERYWRIEGAKSMF